MLKPRIKKGPAYGLLDAPSQDDPLEGEILRVRGWCFFAGSHVARVEVLVDGASVGKARIYLPRPDIPKFHDDRNAPVCGFELLLAVEPGRRHGDLVVSVEATSLDGRIWRSESHLCTWPDTDDDSASRTRAQLVDERAKVLLGTLPAPGRKLMVFTHSLSIGGGQLWLDELLRQVTEFPELKCEVVSFQDGPLRKKLEKMGIPVSVTVPPHVDSVDAYLGRVSEIAALMRVSGAGVILINTIGLFVVAEAAKLAQLPIIWAIHESFETPVFRFLNFDVVGIDPDPVVRERFDASLGLADALIFEAKQTGDLFAHLSNPDQRFVLDYGVNVAQVDDYRASIDRARLRAEAGFSTSDIVVSVIGVLEDRKAQAAVVAAFDELCVVHPRLRLLLVGAHDHLYTRCLVEQIERYGIEDLVTLVDVTPDIYPWYAASDIFVCASDVESLPRSILEAMAFELPVVSTDAFGIVDLIDNGRTGWLTDMRDVEALTGLLHYVLGLSDEERRTVGAAARSEILHRHGENSYGRAIARAAIDLLAGKPTALVDNLSPPVEVTNA